jgi:hypothetical protein
MIQAPQSHPDDILFCHWLAHADIVNTSIRQTVKRSIYTVLTYRRDRFSMPVLLRSRTAANVLTGNPDRLAMRELFFNLSCAAVVALFIPRANNCSYKFQFVQTLIKERAKNRRP